MLGNGNVNLMRGVTAKGSIVIDLFATFYSIYWKNDLPYKIVFFIICDYMIATFP